MQDDEEALGGVLGAMVIVAYILIATICQTVEWLQDSISFPEFIVWSIAIIIILSAWKVSRWLGKNKHK